MFGRKFNAKRIKVSGGVDVEIEKVLRAKALELHLPVGVIIESALWIYLGRPKLSFEFDNKEDTSTV
jgi:hypothetical protein